MPNEHNTERRHPIAKMKFKVTNWAEYDAGPRRRGSLTIALTQAKGRLGWQKETGYGRRFLRLTGKGIFRPNHDPCNNAVSKGICSSACWRITSCIRCARN